MIFSLLQILNFFTDDGIELLNANFAIIGKLYGYMIELSTTTNARSLNQYLEGLTKSFYTIAGIFMLFRLSISVFNYIIDPDKMSDSKTGPGKLITNVVITIVLLAIFMPGGFVINALNEVENVFLYNISGDTVSDKYGDNKDYKKSAVDNGKGFFANLFSNVNEKESSASNSVDISYNDSFLIDSVKADEARNVSGNDTGSSGGSAKEGTIPEKFGHGLDMEEGIFANSVAGAFYSCNITGDAADKAKKAVLKDYNEDLKKWDDSKKDSKKKFKPNDYTYEDDENKRCYAFEVAPLFIKDSGDKGKELVSDEQMDYYFFTGIVFTIVMMIYLIILCVEVILRNLKLILFQIIAPIPIINGIDPNDKMRAQWLKSYFSAYLDLFMKIFCIHLLARIVTIIPRLGDELGTMGRIFFLVALLTFVKMVPNLISKILGIDGFMGSAKEVGGMLKKGLGVGAAASGAVVGAGIGATVGAMTAQGKGGKALGALKGLGSGARSGAKKDLTSGARNIAASNKRDRDSGLGFWQRQEAKLRGNLGLPDAYEEAKEKKEAYDDFANKASLYNDEGVNLSKKLLSKGNAHNFVDLKEAYDDASKIERGESVKRWRIQEDGTMVDKLTGSTRKVNKDGTITYTGKDSNGKTVKHTMSQDSSKWSDEQKKFYNENSKVFNTWGSNLTAGEANTRITGAEKSASKQIRHDIETGNVDKYVELGADDILKMQSLHAQADSAAKSTGDKDIKGYGLTKDKNGEIYDSGYDAKDIAERKSREESVKMDNAAAAHLYGNNK